MQAEVWVKEHGVRFLYSTILALNCRFFFFFFFKTVGMQDILNLHHEHASHLPHGAIEQAVWLVWTELCYKVKHVSDFMECTYTYTHMSIKYHINNLYKVHVEMVTVWIYWVKWSILSKFDCFLLLSLIENVKLPMWLAWYFC